MVSKRQTVDVLVVRRDFEDTGGYWLKEVN